ncbi:putative ATP-dependent bile acid permease [Cercophora scortea]|uniref:ATP-dependent bile acid permease n=1 Tax=Cercophora scortea TaxID=314031 RepID=A0AAE0M706_9PEZI|nr:putative ATP-dependent bile acid permease [Cercophora scortea]
MTELLCTTPPWQDGHISRCVIETLVPLSASLISFAILCLWQLIHWKQHFGSHRPVASHADSFEGTAAEDKSTFHVRYTAKIPRPFRLLEAAGLFAEFIANLAFFITEESRASGAPLVFSAYLLALVVARSLAQHTTRAHLASHSASLYAVQLIYSAFAAHAALFDQHQAPSFTPILIRLGLFTGLVLIHGLAPRTPTHDGADDFPVPGLEERASLISRLLFSWINSLLRKAYKAGPLEATDLFPLSPLRSSAVVVPQFHTKAHHGTSLLWRIFFLLKKDLLLQGAWAGASSVAVCLPPILIRFILEHLEAPETITRGTAWLCVTGLLVSNLIAGISNCQCGWIGSFIAAKLRSVLLSEIYAKVLRKRVVRPPKSSDSGQQTETTGATSDGAILNFVSGDVDFITMMSGALYLVWVVFPVQITIGTYLLYKVLGISGVIGIGLMIALLPINMWISKRFEALQGQVRSATDERIQTSNELLQTVRVIKYYAWEFAFRERVLDKRRVELKRLRARFVWWSLSMTVFHSLPLVTTMLTFFVHTVVFQRDLGTSVAFPALAMFAIIRIPLDRLSDSITFLIEANVSLVRIGKFLEERGSDKYKQLLGQDGSVIGFDAATLSWPSTRLTSVVSPSEDSPLLTNNDTSHMDFTLRDLTINFQHGTLNVVCGPTGSGKSSLLLALLGEMHLEHGRVLLPGLGNHTTNTHNPTFSTTTAYCPHDPWITNQSIRSNILLGEPFDALRYEQVLQAVALTHDLAALANGDQTIAGESGSRLSGGQKQRVALARALYGSSQHILLDDCLSAIDARTANHVFFQGIRGPLMSGRTCILATHHTQLAVPHAGFVVVLEGGRVKVQGTAEEVMATGLLGSFAAPKGGQVPALEGDEAATDSSTGSDERNTAEPLSSESSKGSDSEAEKEGKSEGAVPWSVVWNYLAAMGSKWFWIVVFFGFAAQQIAALGTTLWIKEWALQYDNTGETQLEASPIPPPPPPPPNPTDKVPAMYYLTIYASLCFAFALITFLRNLVTLSGSLKASSTIFQHLLDAVLFAKFAFLDRPLGQITNRMSKDMAVIDLSLASFSVSAVQLLASMLLVIGLIIYTLPGPAPLIVLALVSAAYYYVTATYIDAARDLKRIESVARSPLYQLIGESIAGCVSIRGYGLEGMFARQNGELVDRLNQPSLLLAASTQWLKLRIDLLSTVVTFSTAVFVLARATTTGPGAAGLVLTYAATFAENMLWFVQIYAIIQQSLTSVERVGEYTSTEKESTGETSSESGMVPGDWPRHGGVCFHAFTARYAAHLDPVLKRVSFRAAAGERVAVVGRTGAGKSSLVLALLRALEVDDDGGFVEIDGVGIADVPLPRLRGEAVTVVPQDAQLFNGSVRENLDPLRQHSDNEMVAVLRSMRIEHGAANYQTDLALDLDRAADKLSRGERQLVCVARGLLRGSRVLVLDEATASVDHAADAAIQAGLRAHAEATGATVITVAHRLRTVADYDRVVVLDGGRVVEQGSVRELLGRTGETALFRRLCEESGDLDAIEGTAK